MFKLLNKRMFSDGRRISRCDIMKMTTDAPYMDNKLHGKVYHTYDDGKVIIEPWVQDMKHGIETVLYDGKKRYQADWYRGMKIGLECWYYPNGNIEWKTVRQLMPNFSQKVFTFLYDEDGKIVNSYFTTTSDKCPEPIDLKFPTN